MRGLGTLERRRRTVLVVTSRGHRPVHEHAALPGIAVVGRVANVSQAITEVAALGPEVVVIDHDLAARGTTETVRRIRTACADVAVLFVSEHPTDSQLVSALEAGASGYIERDASDPDLATAIWRAADGEISIPIATMRRLRESQGAIRWSLGAVEVEALRLLADGFSNADIAERFGMSAGSVRSAIREALWKLRARTRYQGTMLARELDIIP